MTSILNTHILYQLQKVYQLVGIFPCGEVHEVLRQSVAQVRAGLHSDFTGGAAEGWRILYKEKGTATGHFFPQGMEWDGVLGLFFFKAFI